MGRLKKISLILISVFYLAATFSILINYTPLERFSTSFKTTSGRAGKSCAQLKNYVLNRRYVPMVKTLQREDISPAETENHDKNKVYKNIIIFNLNLSPSCIRVNLVQNLNKAPPAFC